MTGPDPDFDSAHPSGHLLVRSCRGGYLHSVALSEGALDTDAATLAEAIVLAADVSFLRAALQIRAEIVAAGHTPSAALASASDLDRATAALRTHRLRRRDGG